MSDAVIEMSTPVAWLVGLVGVAVAYVIWSVLMWLVGRWTKPRTLLTDEEVERAWQAYALAHFQLRNSKPTDLERKGMRAALASREQSQ